MAAKKVKLSENDQKIYDDLKDDMTDSQRGAWMKRRAAEEKAAEDQATEVERWFEKSGDKLILKIKKKSGGVISIYQGNLKKLPGLLTPEVKELLR